MASGSGWEQAYANPTAVSAVTGALIRLVGVAVIMYAPRGAWTAKDIHERIGATNRMEEAMRTVSSATGAAAVLGVLCAPAGLALADNSAQQTIDELKSQGYIVTVDKIGTGPLSDCVVTSVRNPQENTQWLPLVGPVLGGGDDNVLFPVTSRFINVSLHCG